MSSNQLQEASVQIALCICYFYWSPNLSISFQKLEWPNLGKNFEAKEAPNALIIFFKILFETPMSK